MVTLSWWCTVHLSRSKGVCGRVLAKLPANYFNFQKDSLGSQGWGVVSERWTPPSSEMSGPSSPHVHVRPPQSAVAQSPHAHPSLPGAPPASGSADTRWDQFTHRGTANRIMEMVWSSPNQRTTSLLA